MKGISLVVKVRAVVVFDCRVLLSDFWEVRVCSSRLGLEFISPASRPASAFPLHLYLESSPLAC